MGLALLLTAGGAGTGLAMANQATHRATALHATDRRQTASAVAALEDAVIGQLRSRATTAAQSLGVPSSPSKPGSPGDSSFPGATPADPGRLRTAALQVSPQATGALLIDAQGQTRASWQAATGSSAPLRPVTSAGSLISPVFAGPGGTPELAVSVPVAASTSTAPAGTLTVILPAQASGLQAPLAELRLGRTGFAELVDPAGTVAASTTGSGVGLRDQTAHQTAQTAHPAPGAAAANLVTATQPLAALPGANWQVVIAQSRAEYAGGTSGRGLGWALLLVLAGLLAGLATLAAAVVRVRARARAADRAGALPEDAVPAEAATDGVPSRELATAKEFLATTRQALATAPADDRRIGVVCVRVDGLAQLIDQVGHAVAEDALMVVGRRLQSSVPEPAMAARLSGDEFAVLCPAGLKTEDVIVTALRMEQVASRPVAVSGWVVSLSVMVGAADGSAAEGATAEQLVRNAHLALRSEARPEAPADGEPESWSEAAPAPVPVGADVLTKR